MKRNMKRLRSPKFWKEPKKHGKWTTKPRPGPHRQFESLPLLVILRDILEIAGTGEEAKSIIKMGKVLVDGEPKKDHKYPAGVMDVVSIPDYKSHYRIVPTRKGLELMEIDAAEAGKKICSIVGKTTVRGKKTQLNLHDGRNLVVDVGAKGAGKASGAGEASGAGKYRTGDSLLIEVPSQKILGHVGLERGALALIVKGRNIGLLGRIEDIVITKTKEPNKVICDLGGEKIEVIKDYVFVVGKDEPLLAVEKQGE